MLDVSLVVCFECLFELDFLGVAFGVEDLGFDTEGLLSVCGSFVCLTSGLFPPVDGEVRTITCLAYQKTR